MTTPLDLDRMPRGSAFGTAICLALFLLANSCFGATLAPLLRQFVDAYAAGSVADLPLTPGATGNDLNAREEYAILFAMTRTRELTLRNVRWSDGGRVTADYIAKVDGVEHAGSVTLYTAAGGITRIVHDYHTWPESEGPALADAGQIADKATTAAGLATHTLAEANPLLHGVGAGGMLALGAVMIGVRQLAVRALPLSECVEASRWMGAVGWGAGANNAVAMTGVAAPVAPLVGIIAGAIAWHQEYKGECIDGDVQIAELRSLSTQLVASH
jgi:hypothetical protein